MSALDAVTIHDVLGGTTVAAGVAIEALNDCYSRLTTARELRELGRPASTETMAAIANAARIVAGEVMLANENKETRASLLRAAVAESSSGLVSFAAAIALARGRLHASGPSQPPQGKGGRRGKKGGGGGLYGGGGGGGGYDGGDHYGDDGGYWARGEGGYRGGGVDRGDGYDRGDRYGSGNNRGDRFGHGNDRENRRDYYERGSRYDQEVRGWPRGGNEGGGGGGGYRDQRRA